jgi:hypothetical protein
MSAMTPTREMLRPLAWTRVAFASVLLIRTTPLILWLDPGIAQSFQGLMGWPDGSAFRAPAYGLALPDAVIAALCLVRTLAAVGLLLGYRTLLSGCTAGIAGYLVTLQDAFGFTFTQHLLFVGAFVLGLVDCAAVLAIRREPLRSPSTSRWLLWGFVASIYFWAGVCKLRTDWFDGRTLELFYAEGKLDGALADLLLGTPAMRATFATAVVLLELALPALLLHSRTRRLGLAAALSMHVLIEPIGHPDVLGWGMIALLLSFVRSPEEQAFHAAATRRPVHNEGTQCVPSGGHTNSP